MGGPLPPPALDWWDEGVLNRVHTRTTITQGPDIGAPGAEMGGAGSLGVWGPEQWWPCKKNPGLDLPASPGGQHLEAALVSPRPRLGQETDTRDPFHGREDGVREAGYGISVAEWEGGGGDSEKSSHMLVSSP